MRSFSEENEFIVSATALARSALAEDNYGNFFAEIEKIANYLADQMDFEASFTELLEEKPSNQLFSLFQAYFSDVTSSSEHRASDPKAAYFAGHEKLIQYYQEFLISSPTFARLTLKLRTAAIQYAGNARHGVERAYQQRIILCEKMLNHTFAKPCLTRIIPCDSDPHCGGQQVLLLELKSQFDVKNKVLKKVIYKPTSLTIDYWIIGQEGLVAEVNQFLSNENKLPMPSYRILPREITSRTAPRASGIPQASTSTASSESVMESWGFIEYLPHEPWPIFLYAVEIQNLLDAWSRSQTLELSEFLQEALFKKYQDILPLQNQDRRLILQVQDVGDYCRVKFFLQLKRDYAQYQQIGKTSDFIVTEEALYHYSYECGRLAAILRVIHMADCHHENLIASEQKPVAIDFEFAFSIIVQGLVNTNLFLQSTGAMVIDNYTLESHQFQYSLSAINKEYPLREPKKNRLYVDKLLERNSLWLAKLTDNSLLNFVSPDFAILKETYIGDDIASLSIPYFYTYTDETCIYNASGSKVEINYEDVCQHPAYDEAIHGVIMKALHLSGRSHEFLRATGLSQVLHTVAQLNRKDYQDSLIKDAETAAKNASLAGSIPSAEAQSTSSTATSTFIGNEDKLNSTMSPFRR